ncbi:hypothetical protein [Leucobacter sp. cx-169]|uniref:hypothetical protein n=1 Tax=Leucobacter sp. cx-169 TaxID=2770549 RepID=UPI00165E4F2A|nr:hypothetical protein [Leucobacter sp. cx-169]MBC9927374.1 hypothetical protein [Leucobacter sp. cx-169]
MRKFIALGTALLVLTGCAAEPAEPAPQSASEPSGEQVTNQPVAPDLELDHPSALGDYGPRWVAEFGLPKIRNFEVIGEPDTDWPGPNMISVSGMDLSTESKKDFGQRLLGLGWTAANPGGSNWQWTKIENGVTKLILIEKSLETGVYRIYFNGSQTP